MKRIVLYFVFSFTFIFNACADDRFWVGGSGKWNDKSHWSEKSGGISGAFVPTSGDDVIFDDNSFHNDREMVFIEGIAQCRNMTWKRITHFPVLSGENDASINISGSLAFASGMTNNFKGKIVFSSSLEGNTILTENQIISGDIVFDGENGEWKLLDDIMTKGESSLYLVRGILNTNNKNILCHSFIGSGDATRSLILGSSSVILRGKWDFGNYMNLSFDAGTSSIILPKEKSDKTFLGGNLKYNKTPVTMGACVPSGNPCSFFTLTLTATPDSCAGPPCNGTATAAITGGTSPFTYLWLPSGQTTPIATGLCAGSPIVQVTDGLGNTCDCFIGVSESPLLYISSSSTTSAACNGICDGTATVSPAGGVSPYTYLWLPSGQTTQTSTGLCAGTHTVTVKDAYNCNVVITKTVTQPQPLSLIVSSINISCNGSNNGSASVSPSGGTSPYTYLWSNGETTSAITSLGPGTYTCTITDKNGCVITYSTTITQPGALTVTIARKNLLCNGVCTGSVTATPSGGTMPYTYAWNPGGYTTAASTGLCAGTYSLTVRDTKGCSSSGTVTITEPPALILSPAGKNITCKGLNNGSVSANPSGGTSPYTYIWLPGGCSTDTCTSLVPGTYSITVTDANGCTKTGTVTITEPNLLTVAPSKTDVVCPGLCNGTANSNAAGGTAPYTYLWSNGKTTTNVSALCKGDYTITVTDANSCTVIGNITINMPSPLTASITSAPVSCYNACDGNAVSFPSGGTPPYTYFWSNGKTTAIITGLCAGNYTLTLSDKNGCPKSSTVNITQPNPFAVSISASSNPLNCNGDCNGTAVASVSGGTAPYTYLWNTGSTVPSITGLCAGIYSITVTDTKGCITNTSVTFIQPLALTVTVTPTNPTCNGLNNGSISVVAAGGNPTYTYTWLPGGQNTPSITGLSAGTSYSLTLTDSKGCNISRIITLTAPAVLSNSVAINKNVTCAGLSDGSASIITSGGTAPYTYVWTPSGKTTSTATGLAAGSYIVTITDTNNCSSNIALTITQPSALSSSISSTTSSCMICNGSASVNTTGGIIPYTYSWAPTGQTTSAASGLCIGTYTVTVADSNNCSVKITAIVSPVVTITITVSGTVVRCTGSCNGIATATPFGGFSPYTYLWTPTGQTTQTGTGLCAGPAYSITVTDANGCFASDTVIFTDPPLLTTAMSSSAASCGLCNGTVTASPSGGTGAYTYTWSGFPVQTTAVATGLCSGNYTVTLSDANNCTTTNTVTVVNIPSISDNPSITLSTCGGSDGAICVSPSGGTPGYTYLWSPGGATTPCITGIAAGVDTVIIQDAAGCSDTFAIAVGNLTGPTITIDAKINPSCYGNCNGFISLSASGSPPINFLWPGGQTTSSLAGLCAGTYNIQVTDAVPCTSFVSVTLTDPPQINLTPFVTTISCNGGSDGDICLSPSGGSSPYTFSWSPGGQTTSCITGLGAGTYTITLYDANGCNNTLLIPVTEPNLLGITISSGNIICNGNNNGTATATVAGGTTLYTYAWSTGAVIPSIAGLSPNTYSILVTDKNGCTSTSSVVITEPPLLTTTLTSTNIVCNLLCNGTATINQSGGTSPYTYSWLSSVVTTSTITGLCAGDYFGTVTDTNGCSSTQTVTITQPTALTATVTTTNASCFGGCNGTAAAAVTGGSPFYTYFWNPGGLTTSSVTGLCAGSHTLIVTDTKGCTANQIFSIIEPTQLQANITTSSPSCFGGCDGTATSFPIGGTVPYTYSWNTVPVQTTATATGLCSGSYTLVLSDKKGCFVNQPVTIAATPVLTQTNGVAGATCMLCNGNITVIASGGTSPYSFFWSTGATTADITGLCAGVYIDTVMDANGCISIDTIPVSNTTGPAFTVSGTNITCYNACNGTTSVSSVTGDGPPWFYSWFPSSQTTQTATGLCPNQYFAAVTDTNGCKTIDPVNLTEPQQLASNPVVTNSACLGICNGSIALVPTGGTGAYTYNWMPGALTTQNISSQCPGNYTLTLTDANGCVLTTTVTIGQITILTSSVTSTNALCNGSCDGTANATIGGGAIPYTYSWFPANQTNTAATGLCTGTHTITVTDANGCIRIDSAIITQPAVIVPTITGTNPLCNTSCDGIVSVTPGGGTPPYTYLWVPGGCTTSSCSGLCAGTYTFTLTDANNCSATSAVTLTNPPAIAATSVITNASCTNVCDGIVTVTATGGSPPYTYLWNPTAAATAAATGLCAGTYSVIITDVNGCSFTDTMSVGVVTLVISQAGTDTSFCMGGTATLCSGSFNAISVGWYQLPAWTPAGITNCINVSPPAGVTDYALIATNGICSDTDTVSVTVNNYPVVMPPKDTTICQSDSVTLCASGATNYQWYSLPVWAPVATGNCITVSPVIGTTTYGIIGINGVCSDSDSVTVTVIAMPIAMAGNDTALCLGSSVTLCSNSIGSTSVTWHNIPAWTQIDTTVCIIVIPPSGINDFSLIATNGVCSDTDTVSVTIYALPPVDAGTSVTILSTSSTVLNGTGIGIYNWSPATGLSNTTIANPIAQPTVTTTYTLLVTDANGCTAADTMRVTIIIDVVPYDGISPNGDGINDVWVILGIENFPDAMVEVYNRWGELLFHSIGYKDKWDCTYKGKSLPVGTYYYVINLNSDLHKEPITGPITILR